MTYTLNRTDVHLHQLAGELSQALARTVRVAARPPAANSKPGALVVIDDATDDELDDLDAKTVEAVISAHTPPTPPPTAEDRLAAVESELRGMRERAAAASVTDADAVKVRDAITGPSR